MYQAAHLCLLRLLSLYNRVMQESLYYQFFITGKCCL